MKKILFLSLAAMAMLCACTGGNKFKVSGNVEGAADTTNLYLEVANNGNWFILDSTTTSGGGSYSISYDAPEYPNIYRLRCADKSIYFTVDSIESITIDSKLKTLTRTSISMAPNTQSKSTRLKKKPSNMRRKALQHQRLRHGRSNLPIRYSLMNTAQASWLTSLSTNTSTATLCSTQ